MKETHPQNPELRSWVEVPHDSGFPIQNLPFGLAKPAHEEARLVSALGHYLIDLKALAELGYFEGLGFDVRQVFGAKSLNPFFALGRQYWEATRQKLSELFREDNARLKTHYEHRQKVLRYRSNCQMLMPYEPGDYTDFYSSLEHATNVGKLFRPDNPLMPNWKYLPVGYHGRSSSIRVSGTDFHRPKGQIFDKASGKPHFGASQMLDYELEMAFVMGRGTRDSERVRPEAFGDYAFGLQLFNDWSARDIQAWEYQPLGPFLAKNFASTVSPWVVSLQALAPFRVPGPEQDPPPMPYLAQEGPQNFDIHLEVCLKPAGGDEVKVSESNTKYLYWSFAQQLAHHTVGGCPMRPGDVCASGTISGPEGRYGCLLEQTKRGQYPVELLGGYRRAFLEDGDEVILRAWAESSEFRIGFGEVRSKVLPALPYH